MPTQKRELLLLVTRRCLVCEHEQRGEEAEGTDAIGVPCTSCRAPTERVGIHGRRARLVAANPAAAALGRLGGLKGGPARAQALSAERRRDIARHAARKRWENE